MSEPPVDSTSPFSDENIIPTLSVRPDQLPGPYSARERELTKRCKLPICAIVKHEEIRRSERKMGTEATYLGRLLFQLEEPLFGELVLPFLLHFWRQLRAVLLECRLGSQHALERHLRELLPKNQGESN
jgi:hypothetical protein